MRVRTFTAAAAIAWLALPASAQTLDEIIAKHLQARGGLEKLRAVQTLRMTGTMTMGPGLEVPVVLEMKRPNMLRLELTVQGMTGTQAFDGQTGWSLMPFGGRTEPEAMPPDVAKEVEQQADFDGPLVDYTAKGHTVELIGKEQVEGAEAYKIKVTLKNGSVRYTFIDAEAFLETRVEAKRTIRGSEVETESSIGDYKEIDGLMFAHSMETGAKGSPQKQKMSIAKIELNVPVDEARFKMPEVKKPGGVQ